MPILLFPANDENSSPPRKSQEFQTSCSLSPQNGSFVLIKRGRGRPPTSVNVLQSEQKVTLLIKGKGRPVGSLNKNTIRKNELSRRSLLRKPIKDNSYLNPALYQHLEPAKVAMVKALKLKPVLHESQTQNKNSLAVALSYPAVSFIATPNAANQNEFQIECTECQEQFSTFVLLRQHFQLKHKQLIRQFVLCCNEKFFQRKKFQHHCETIHSEETLAKTCPCQVCKQKFSTCTALKNHLLGHILDEKYKKVLTSCNANKKK